MSLSVCYFSFNLFMSSEFLTSFSCNLQQVLAGNGGVVQIVAGGSFAAALTASGRVVVWGQLRGLHGAAPAESQGVDSPCGMGGQQQGSAIQQEEGELGRGERASMRIRGQRGGWVVGEVVNQPPATALAAGFGHLLFTDGGRVWSLGGRPPVAGPDPHAAAGALWREPQQVLDLSAVGVASVAAGGFASAAVGGDGRLYMWGSLLTKEVRVGMGVGGGVSVRECVYNGWRPYIRPQCV
jgi:hypothetical protein